MKILDRNYRLFGIVNPVDLLVLLLLVAMGSVGYSVLKGGSPFDSGEAVVPARVTLLVREVRDTAVDIEIGDEVIKSGVGSIGNVVEVTERPALREVPTADGGLRVVESTLFREALVVVEGPGRITNAGVVIGDVLLAVNELIEIKTPMFAAKMTVASLDIAE